MGVHQVSSPVSEPLRQMLSTGPWLLFGLTIPLVSWHEDLCVETSRHSATNGHKTLGSDYFSTVLLTLTNPTTILSFIAVFAGLGLASNVTVASASLITLGVFLGSALWWLLLSGGVGLIRTKFKLSTLGVVNRLSGIVLVVFGLLAFASIP